MESELDLLTAEQVIPSAFARADRFYLRSWHHVVLMIPMDATNFYIDFPNFH